jgi:hypothetical protein
MLVWVGSERPPPFIHYSYTITYKVAVYAPAERADTLPLFHLYPYVPYSVVAPCLFEPQNTYFPRDETGLVCLPTQLERTLQLYW